MTTFSQLVDGIIDETKRPDLLNPIVSYLRQTIRECHLDPDRNTPLFMWGNYNEATIQADMAQGFYWLVPDLARFQGLLKVRYDSVFLDAEPVYAMPLVNNRVAESQHYAYQVVGDRVLFKGYGGVNAIISLAYYEYPPSLKYYPVGARPATYDEVDGFTYLPAFDSDDALRQQARDLVTHWMLLRWPMALEEGVRAKLYKRLGDDPRARLSYSAYMQIRAGLVNSEKADLAGAR